MSPPDAELRFISHEMGHRVVATRLIRPDDMLRHAEEWDEVVAGAFPMIGAVAQPLWPLVKEAPEVPAGQLTPEREPAAAR